MHSSTLRDDISVSSARTATSRQTSGSDHSSFYRQTSGTDLWSTVLGRRKSRDVVHRDDLSEYSNPSSWGERSGPLSLSDHRLGPEGLQARRTVGEAILRAQWDRRSADLDLEARSCESRTQSRACPAISSCFARFPRISLESWQALRRREPRPSTVFTWGEVLSLLLVPSEKNGPYLIVISTIRPAADGSREWLLQAGSLRAAARCGIEMSYAILQSTSNLGSSPPVNSCVAGCTPGRSPVLSLILFMDIVRVACEAARHQPSSEGMCRLQEVLDLLVDSSEGEQRLMHSPAPPMPVAALRRFSDAVRRAHHDFMQWMLWQEVSLFIRDPPGLTHLWHARILPFLKPQMMAEVDANRELTRELEVRGYPAAVNEVLVSAAERCHKMLTS